MVDEREFVPYEIFRFRFSKKRGVRRSRIYTRYTHGLQVVGGVRRNSLITKDNSLSLILSRYILLALPPEMTRYVLLNLSTSGTEGPRNSFLIDCFTFGFFVM